MRDRQVVRDQRLTTAACNRVDSRPAMTRIRKGNPTSEFCWSRLNGLSVIGIGDSSVKYYPTVMTFVCNKSKPAWPGTTSIIRTSKALTIVSYTRLRKIKRARQGWDYGVTRSPFRPGNFGMGIDFSLKDSNPPGARMDLARITKVLGGKISQAPANAVH